jgi:hypothetical protein
LNETDKGGEENMSYTRDRGFSKSRRMGKDEEEEQEELKEILNDPDAPFKARQSALMALCSEDEEVYPTVREIGEDRRGPHSYARDALEHYRSAKAARDKRRLGKDFGPENLTDPNSLREMEQRSGAEDRRRLAGDMAYDTGGRGTCSARQACFGYHAWAVSSTDARASAGRAAAQP